MDVYFIRHGQTDGNVARRHQHPDTPLNDIGLAQAQVIAEHLTVLSPDYLITSTNKRALETARAIGLACGLIPETYPVFEELKRPTYLLGERMLGRTTLAYIVRWFLGDTRASMHDGESYQAFSQRIERARQALEQLPPTAVVVVVSHSVFINFFIAQMSHRRRMSMVEALVWFIKILLTKNTSVTHVRFLTRHAHKPGRGWRVMRSINPKQLGD
jgi:alpha-ribazole phosphatase